MTTNFSVKIGEIDLFGHSDFKKIICDDLAILFVYFVNLGPVTPKFKRVIY